MSAIAGQNSTHVQRLYPKVAEIVKKGSTRCRQLLTSMVRCCPHNSFLVANGSACLPKNNSKFSGRKTLYFPSPDRHPHCTGGKLAMNAFISRNTSASFEKKT